jgi:Cu(I)/Ag(I) efflux system protein CusF
MSRLLKPLFLILIATSSLPALADDMGGMGNMDMKSMPAAPAVKTAHGVGVVKAFDAAAGTITLSHKAIKELNWPAMTMSFKVAKPELLKDVTVGQIVHFSLQGHDMDQTVTAISP